MSTNQTKKENEIEDLDTIMSISEEKEIVNESNKDNEKPKNSDSFRDQFLKALDNKPKEDDTHAPNPLYNKEIIKGVEEKILWIKFGLGFVLLEDILFSLSALIESFNILLFLLSLAVLGACIYGWYFLHKTKDAQIDRFYLYANALKDNPILSIDELAHIVVRDDQTTQKDIQHMISHNWFETVFYDSSTQTVYASYALYKKNSEKVQTEETVDQSVGKTKNLSEIKDFTTKMDQYRDSINTLSSQIQDEDIKQKCEQMNMILTKIQDYIVENFDDVDKTNRVMKYYIPTALRILKNYKDLETGNVSETSAQDVRNALNQFNDGLLDIYTSICQDASIDIQADISLLNSLMEQDGVNRKKEEEND